MLIFCFISVSCFWLSSSRNDFIEIWGTSMKISNLSKRGPEILFWYFFICFGVHLQVLFLTVKWPHGQLFIAAINVNFAGNVCVELALFIFIYPSSSGCLKTSNTSLGNSVISSRKRTPLFANVISPGLMLFPPPTIAILEAVWWTSRNGLWVMRGTSFGRRPVIE